ncbi:MAG: glutathione S-transferase family protein [Deltaproteobacteria bacterium]|nr:glutathione S-transferase family protein [Deltaproteobacteria bacterium]
MWTLEEVGANYEFNQMDFMKGDHKKEEYLKLNPNARVPTLVDDEAGLVLFESAAICQYIARAFPKAGLLPERGGNQEAMHDQWMFWVVTELEQALWSMGKHRFALPAEHRIPEMQKTALFEWQRATPVLAAALEKTPFIIGEQMHLIDVMAAHTLLWARGFKVAFQSDALEQFLDRMLARPAYQACLRFD